MENEKKRVNFDRVAIIIICAIELISNIWNLISCVSHDKLIVDTLGGNWFDYGRTYIIEIVILICYICAFSSEKMKRYALIPFALRLIHSGYYLVNSFINIFRDFDFYGLLYLVLKLLITAVWALMIVLSLCCLSKRNKINFKINAEQFWEIPCVLAAVYVLLLIIQQEISAFSTFSFAYISFASIFYFFDSIIGPVIYPLCLLYFSAHNIVFPEASVFSERKKAVEKKKTNKQDSYTENADNSSSANKNINNQYGYCSLGKHVALLLLTFGIWLLIWIYRITDVTNIPDREKRNPTNKLLLCMFVPFYQIYWIYETSKRVELMAKEKNLECNISTICLICEFLLPIVPPILIQDKLNAVISASPAKQPPEYQTEVQYTKSESVTNISDELTAYKEMLESGLISPEDYEKKKNQILGLK